MNRWVQRGLRTALLTGGLLAAGAGVAAADENDVTADALGVTATVPVQDGAVLQTPVVTGTGEDLAIGSEAGDGLTLPVDTDTEPGTTALGDDGPSVPVRVTEADDTPPDPAGGLIVTVPVNTSGGGTAGTTVTVPVVTGDLGDVLDGDLTTGTAVEVDLTDPLTAGPGGSGLLLDLEDTATVGDDGPATGGDPVLEAPVPLDGDRPTTVELPVRGAEDGGRPSGESVEVGLGGLLGTAGGSGDGEPDLSVSIGRGGRLGGDAASGPTVDVDLGGLLGDTGTAPSPGAGGPSGEDTGSDDDHGAGSAPAATHDGDGQAAGAVGPRTGADGAGTGADGAGAGTSGAVDTLAGGPDGDCTGQGWVPGTAGNRTSPGTGPATGGPSAGDPGSAGPATGDACGTGPARAAATRPASITTTPGGPPAASAGLLAVAGLLLAAGRGRLWRDRAPRHRA